MAACRLSMDTEHLRFFFDMAMAITAMVLLFSIFRYRNFNVLIGKCGRSCFMVL